MMRFTIRDVLWLTVVAALAATMYIDRARTQDLISKWDEQSELQAQQTAAELAALRATVADLREQKRILQHRLAAHSGIAPDVH